ncbi:MULTISPECIES: hypothetical protein [Dyella]|uniref:Uncharacterized protein n=2 Tax=Dyella TaxID=231454 RepID=A0A4R0YRL3_9GAMM|nr:MULTISPECIES: hypothetical protein [Dyella]TBR40596.1 hypothetical protein EYV96_10705 [Dyella terrae]TCI11822.1 hypothetical protein EZM97_00165 [Dyella soli]
MGNNIEEPLERACLYGHEGAVVTIKMDGARLLTGIRAIYTDVISGGRLAVDDLFRQKGENLAELVHET